MSNAQPKFKIEESSFNRITGFIRKSKKTHFTYSFKKMFKFDPTSVGGYHVDVDLASSRTAGEWRTG